MKSLFQQCVHSLAFGGKFVLPLIGIRYKIGECPLGFFEVTKLHFILMLISHSSEQHFGVSRSFVSQLFSPWDSPSFICSNYEQSLFIFHYIQTYNNTDA